jgi:hypothetical protein
LRHPSRRRKKPDLGRLLGGRSLTCFRSEGARGALNLGRTSAILPGANAPPPTPSGAVSSWGWPVTFGAQLNDLSAHQFVIYSVFRKQHRGERPRLTEDAQQQMLGADVMVSQKVRLLRSGLQDLAGFGAEWDLGRGWELLANGSSRRDLLPDPGEGYMRAHEKSARPPLAFAQQAKQQMLCFDLPTTDLIGFVAGKEERAPRPLAVAFEHFRARFLPRMAAC